MDRIEQLFPEVSWDKNGEFYKLACKPEQSKALLSFLKKDAGFDTLSCLTAVDWPAHFEVVYFLFSASLNKTAEVKVKLENKNEPAIDSIYSLWKGAAVQENEVYDMFGIKFNGHPAPERIILGEDWKGYPLRKDYEDARMTKLE